MKFDFTKNKTLSFNVQVEGLDSTKLKFLFSILIDGVYYGFNGTMDGSKVKIDVPAFSTFMKDNIITSSKSYEACLMAYDGKFCVEPWKDSISFDITPMMTVKLTSESTKIKASLIKEQSRDQVIDYTDQDTDLISQDTEKNFATRTMGATQGMTPSTNFNTEDDDLAEDDDLHLERYDLSIGKDKVRNIIKKVRLEAQKEKLNKKIKKEDLDLHNNDLGSVGREKADKIVSNTIKESIHHNNIKPAPKNFVPKTHRDLKLFLESRGMKTEDTQERLLERAKELGGDDVSDQYMAIRKMLGIDKPAGTSNFDIAAKLNSLKNNRGD